METPAIAVPTQRYVPPREWGLGETGGELVEAAPSAEDGDVNDEISIAVMGTTGSGKSTFVNLISGSDLEVGKGLRSCTSEVGTSNVFTLSGRLVTFLDTPGFDDSSVSDTDVLKTIATFLAATYKAGKKLSGIIYMHRISDFRVGGIARRNFNMFRKLCGEDSLRNVVIVTNMWSGVTEDIGAAREIELKTDPDLFKPVLDNGAIMMRHDGSYSSAKNILQYLINKHPRPLRIQKELVDERKDIMETGAGEEVSREIAALIQKHQKDMDDLRREMAEALAAKDMQMKAELEVAYKGFTEKITKLEKDRDQMSRLFEDAQTQADERMKKLQAELVEAREARNIAQSDISELKKLLLDNRQASWVERLQWMDRLHELESKSRRGLFKGFTHRFFHADKTAADNNRQSIAISVM